MGALADRPLRASPRRGGCAGGGAGGAGVGAGAGVDVGGVGLPRRQRPLLQPLRPEPEDCSRGCVGGREDADEYDGGGGMGHSADGVEPGYYELSWACSNPYWEFPSSLRIHSGIADGDAGESFAPVAGSELRPY